MWSVPMDIAAEHSGTPRADEYRPGAAAIVSPLVSVT
jgi:hypothetical protein